MSMAFATAQGAPVGSLPPVKLLGALVIAALRTGHQSMSEFWARMKSDFYCLVLSDYSRWPMRGMWTIFGRWYGMNGNYYRRYRDMPGVSET